MANGNRNSFKVPMASSLMSFAPLVATITPDLTPQCSLLCISFQFFRNCLNQACGGNHADLYRIRPDIGEDAVNLQL